MALPHPPLTVRRNFRIDVFGAVCASPGSYRAVREYAADRLTEIAPAPVAAEVPAS